MARLQAAPVGKGKLKGLYDKHYFVVYLWKTQADYEKAAEVEQPNTIALCVTDTHCEIDTGLKFVEPKLGALHFVSGTWDLNTVAHEVTHAMLHRMRYLHPVSELVMEEDAPDFDPDHEEMIAYQMGAWVEACWDWLNKTDLKKGKKRKVD